MKFLKVAKFGFIVFLLLITNRVFSVENTFSYLKNGHDIINAPKINKPKLHKSIIDPVFNTKITRITDPSQVPNVSRIRHYYSKSNPFNSDETLAIMHGSNGTKWLYDAKNWKPLYKLLLSSNEAEIQWHPTIRNKFYFLGRLYRNTKSRGMFLYNTTSKEKTLLHDFSEYKKIRGKLEGNTDKHGRYYALLGTNGSDNEIFVYDLINDKISKKVSVSKYVASDWVSVSTNAGYVVAMGRYRSRIYDIKMNFIRDLPRGTYGHGDLCLGFNQEEYLVFDGADYVIGRNRNINRVNLKTGEIDVITRIGWNSTPHVSCRNVNKPGWALISTQGPDHRYPNHDFEIFWVKLDGSGEIRRVAHHRSVRDGSGYFAEQHAVTNKNANKIVFTSNWGRKGPIYDYLIELPTNKSK